MDNLSEALSGARPQEDQVRYRVYSTSWRGDESEAELAAAAAAYLEALKDDVDGAIWQHEGFALHPAVSTDATPPHLTGSTLFGDSIDDEWFIVYLLRKLTSLFQDLVVSVTDTDGEFLLIEAAMALPAWVTPDTVENRVFLHRGELHLIPPEIGPKAGAGSALPLRQALQVITGGGTATRAPAAVLDAIALRLNPFPQRMRELLHHVACYVPAGVAAILEQDPQLVSAAVGAFHRRDPVDERVAKKMELFPPVRSVYSRVRFTRCLYAQLSQQSRFQLPVVFGKAPPVSSNRHKAFTIGAKLACGFEILCSNARRHQGDGAQDSQVDCSGPRWQAFLTQLGKRDYFQGEMEGSRRYKELMARAREYYASIIYPANEDEDDWEGAKALRLLRDVDVEKYAAEHNVGLSDLPADDSEAWMEVAPDDLEAMWAARMGAPAQAKGGVGDESDAEMARALKETMGDLAKFFTAARSDYEGAEVPSDVTIDSDRFMDTLKDLLGGLDVADADGLDEFLGSDTSDDEEVAGAGEGDDHLDSYYGMMAQELRGSKVMESFAAGAKEGTSASTGQDAPEGRTDASGSGTHGEDIEEVEEVDDDGEVDVDLNLLRNMLESFSAQEGMAGPVGNILRSLGMSLPEDADKVGGSAESS